MSEQPRFLGRIGTWFRRGRGGGDLISPEESMRNGGAIEPVSAVRGNFLRPWARNEQAIGKLQEGFVTLTDLMGSVRDHMQRQSSRQDELLAYLAHLPEAIQSLPESNRVHGETLRAIHQQLAQQNDAQGRLVEVLEKLGRTGGETRQVMDDIRDGVQALGQYDQRLSETLGGVGSAMQNVSRNSETSTRVLESLRDNLSRHDAELERIIRRQNTRFTTMLAVAIVLATAALAAVAVFGYLIASRMNG